MRRLALVALATALAACPGRPVDPLADERARLAQLEREPLAEGWPAQAAIVIAADMVAAKIEQAFSNAVLARQQALHLEPGFGVILDVEPVLHVKHVAVAPATECPRCVAATLSLRGQLALRGQVLGVPLQTRTEVTATLDGVLESWLASGEDRHRVQVRPVASAAWGVDLAIQDLPATWSQGLSSALETQLERALVARPLAPIDVVELDAEGPVRLRGVRLEAGPDGGLVVALAFAALDAGAVVRLPQAASGLLLHLPQSTALALARAAALRQPPVDGHAVEPLRLQFRGEQFELWLRIWEVAARPSARDFHVCGRVAVIDGERLALQPEVVRELGPAGQRYDPLHLLSRAAILGRLTDSLAAALPATAQRESLGQVAQLQVERVVGVDDALAIHARLELAPAPIPAAAVP